MSEMKRKICEIAQKNKPSKSVYVDRTRNLGENHKKVYYEETVKCMVPEIRGVNERFLNVQQLYIIKQFANAAVLWVFLCVVYIKSVKEFTDISKMIKILNF